MFSMRRGKPLNEKIMYLEILSGPITLGKIWRNLSDKKFKIKIKTLRGVMGMAK
jgi:hypothetical protein